jgi:hypothetical protein
MSAAFEQAHKLAPIRLLPCDCTAHEGGRVGDGASEGTDHELNVRSVAGEEPLFTLPT